MKIKVSSKIEKAFLHNYLVLIYKIIIPNNNNSYFDINNDYGAQKSIVR